MAAEFAVKSAARSQVSGLAARSVFSQPVASSRQERVPANLSLSLFVRRGVAAAYVVSPKQKKGVPGLDGESNSIPLEVISPRSVAAAMA